MGFTEKLLDLGPRDRCRGRWQLTDGRGPFSAEETHVVGNEGFGSTGYADGGRSLMSMERWWS